jgi:hypothetical protein
MRSTGLGKTELKAHISGITRVDDSILFKVKTTEPVRWEVRNLFQQDDIPRLVSLMLKPGNIKFFIKALIKKTTSANEPESF